jgi:hypothetical protein
VAAGNYNLMLTLFDNYNDSISANTTVNLQPAILNSIRQLNRNYIVSVFPNPASNLLMVDDEQLAVKQIKINNALGQILIEQPLTSDKVQSIDISSLSSGLYFYSITTEDAKTVTGKFVKD